MEFVFEQPAWLQQLQAYKSGDSISAAGFLTLLETEEPACVEEAMAYLDDNLLSLDVSDLPALELTGSNALRLKQEAQLPTAEAATEGLDDNDPLRLYLQELAGTPVAADPQLLAQRYSAGDRHLAEQLVNACLAEVVHTAMEYTGHGVLLLDLIQEGSLGLWQSITNYSEGDFLTYARWWIRHYMAKAVTLNARSNGIGMKLRQGMLDYVDADQRLLAELGRNPTLQEIAELLHITVDEAATIEKMVSQARKQEGRSAPQAQVEEEEDQAVENTAYFQLRQRIAELMAVLPQQDAKVLALRFGLDSGKPLSPVQVGELLGMTPEQVVRREEAALSRLRNQ